MTDNISVNNTINQVFVTTPGPQGIPGTQGASATAINPLAITSSLIPASDNTYYLGSASMRWKGLFLGASTLYLTDTVTASNIGLTVTNGVLNISGSVQIQTGNIRITPTGINSTASAQDITIGNTGDTGYLSTARGIKFPDGTVQNTAATTGNIRVVPGYVNNITIDWATDKIVHLHVNSGSLGITFTNFNSNAGKEIELLAQWGSTSGGSISINGLSSSNISNGNNGFAITKQFNSIRFYGVDGTASNTFAVVTIS